MIDPIISAHYLLPNLVTPLAGTVFIKTFFDFQFSLLTLLTLIFLITFLFFAPSTTSHTHIINLLTSPTTLHPLHPSLAMKFSIGVVALALIVVLMGTCVFAQEEDPVNHAITFNIPQTLYSGDLVQFKFKSDNILKKDDVFRLAWDDKIANTGRATNCQFFTQMNPDPGYLYTAFNMAINNCFIDTEDSSAHLTNGPSHVAAIANPPNCNDNVNPFLTINMRSTISDEGIPAETWITCDVQVAPTQMVLQDVSIKAVVDEKKPFTFVLLGEEVDPRMKVIPTKAYIESARQTDDWGFTLSVYSERVGMVNLAMVPALFNFDGTGYTSDNVWCSGRTARIVPSSSAAWTWNWSRDKSVNLHFLKANSTTSCFFKIRPSNLNFIFPKTTPIGGAVSARLHQQPLQRVFNTTQEQFKEQATFFYNPGPGFNYDSDKTVSNLQPTIQLTFPIPPEVIKDTVYFAKLSALDGTTLPPEQFLALTTVSNGGGGDTIAAVDLEDPTRIKITYNVDYISPGWQRLGVQVIQTTPLTEASRLRYQVTFTDAVGAALIGTQPLEVEWVSPFIITAAEQSWPSATSLKLTAKIQPVWASSTPKSYVRIYLHSDVAESATCSIGGSSANVINKRGVIFVEIDTSVDLNTETEVDCTIISSTPYLYGASYFDGTQVSVVPANIALLNYFPPGATTNSVEQSFTGYISLSQDKPVYPEPPPPEMMLLQDEVPSGWTEGMWAFTFTTRIHGSNNYSDMMDELEERVQRVLDKVIIPFSEGSDALRNSTFAGLYYHVLPWLPSPTPVKAIPGTFDQSRGVLDLAQSEWLVTWSISRVHLTLSGEEFTAYVNALAAALKLADKGTPATETEAAVAPLLEAGDLYTSSNYIDGAYFFSWMRVSEQCKGVSSWGNPGCARRLPGQSCSRSQQCSRVRCLSTGKCAEHLTPDTPFSSTLTGPEGIASFSPLDFQYASDASTITTIFALILMMVAIAF